MFALKKQSILGAAIAELLIHLSVDVDEEIISTELEKYPHYPIFL
jgi:hypothetical protein